MTRCKASIKTKKVSAKSVIEKDIRKKNRFYVLRVRERESTYVSSLHLPWREREREKGKSGSVDRTNRQKECVY